MEHLTLAQSVGTLIAGALTLMMYSFLYKDNFFYKLGEHLYVGISVGYLVNITWYNVVTPQFIVPFLLQKQYILIIPAILGLMMLARFVRQVSWLSRTPMAFFVGMGCGMAIPAVLNASILQQLHSTIIKLWVQAPMATVGPTLWWWNTLSLWLVFLGVLSVLFYFYFSIEHKGVVGKLGNIGIWFVMISFGASFGYTVMARVSLLIGRVQFLVDQVPKAWHVLTGGGA
jgi:hypothetical protein